MSGAFFSWNEFLENGPQDWPVISLGRAVEPRNEINQPELPLLSVTASRGVVYQDVLGRRDRSSADKSKYKRVLPGDIVYNTMRMWQGVSGLSALEGIVSPAYNVLYPALDVCGEYIAHLFKFNLLVKVFRSRSQGLVDDTLSLRYGELAKIRVRLPPLPEQRKVAAILSSVNETIAKTDILIEKLLALRRALLHQLFEAGSNGRARWRLGRLGEVAYIQTGIAKGKSVEGETREVPYLRVANVQDGILDLGELKTLQVAPNAIERYALRRGDVLFTEGGDADKLGRSCVWKGEVEPCLHQNHVFAVRVDRETLLPEFLSYFGSSPRGRDYFLSCAKQTTNLASINSSQLKAMPVPLPPLEEQGKIIAIMGSVEARIQVERRVQEKISSLKSVLSAALLTGQLRVIPDEAPHD